MIKLKKIQANTKSIKKVLVLTLQRVQETPLVQREDQKESYPVKQTEQKQAKGQKSQYLDDKVI